MKQVVITGISRGIGLATAQQFDALGYSIVGCASSTQSIADLRQAHPHWRVFQADMADKAAVQAFAQQVLALPGEVEVLVNNAGKFLPGQIQDEAEGVFEEQMQLNLASAYHLTRALLPAMLRRRSGSIVNLCSTASITAYTNGGSYCISKFALLGFSKVLREELKPHNIRVISVLPGATLTSSWAGTELPPERFMQPADVAQAVAMACTLPQCTVIEEILLRPMLGDIV